MKRLLTPIALLALAGAVSTSCAFKNEKSQGGTAASSASTAAPAATATGTSGTSAAPTTTTSGGTATYTQISQQILQPKCTGCHSSGGQSPDLSSYNGFATDTRYVMPGDPNNSALYQVVQSGSMPRGGSPLSSAELQLIYDWIQNGAKND